MPSAILDRFCQKVSQIIQSQGTACFTLSAADNRLYLQAVADFAEPERLYPGLHVEIDNNTEIAAAVVEAIATEACVIVDQPLQMSDAQVPGPAMVVPVIWERQAIEPDEEPIKHPVGILTLWGKRGAETFDREDQQLAEALAEQAAALLIEEHLEEFEEIQAAFAAVRVGLMLVDTDRTIVVANAAARQVIEVDSLQGRPISQIDYQGQLEGLISQLQQAKTAQATSSFITRGGELYATSAQLTAEQQSIIAFIQSPFSTAAEELVGQVAHELRTPLTVIQGNLQTIELLVGDGITQEDQQIIEEFIGTALIQASRMFRLISETLNISRIHAGKEIELAVTKFSLAEALDQILTELADRLAGHEVACELSDSATIEGDRDKVISILDNYLKNAAKYANPGTTITVRIKDRDNQVVLEVEDQGIGIREEDLQRLGREPGFRTELSKDQAGGIGLGLVYVRRVTEAHGGRMEVESQVGKGSTFRSILPKHQPDYHAPKAALELT